MFKKQYTIKRMEQPVCNRKGIMKIINVMAASLDGEIASSVQEGHEARQASGLSSPEDYRRVAEDLRQADGVIVGAESVRAGGGIWEQLNYRGVQPPWVVITRRGFVAESPFWQQRHVPRALVSDVSIPAVYDPTVTCLIEADPVHAALTYLRQQGAKRVLLFGGGYINTLFYAAKQVDELKLCLSPLLIGSGAALLLQKTLPQAVKLQLLHCETHQSQVFLHYAVERS
jgi:riboflavin biosynthesis pyrimidine reductase